MNQRHNERNDLLPQLLFDIANGVRHLLPLPQGRCGGGGGLTFELGLQFGQNNSLRARDISNGQHILDQVFLLIRELHPRLSQSADTLDRIVQRLAHLQCRRFQVSLQQGGIVQRNRLRTTKHVALNLGKGQQRRSQIAQDILIAIGRYILQPAGHIEQFLRSLTRRATGGRKCRLNRRLRLDLCVIELDRLLAQQGQWPRHTHGQTQTNVAQGLPRALGALIHCRQCTFDARDIGFHGLHGTIGQVVRTHGEPQQIQHSQSPLLFSRNLKKGRHAHHIGGGHGTHLGGRFPQRMRNHEHDQHVRIAL